METVLGGIVPLAKWCEGFCTGGVLACGFLQEPSDFASYQRYEAAVDEAGRIITSSTIYDEPRID